MTSDLPRLLAGPAPDAARGLLGTLVRANGVTVRLAESEAYLGTGEDPASHAHRGPTPRTTVMFGPPGGLYVYFSYGMHWCANVVCGPEGMASAVLLRAGEVVEGIRLARERRGAAVDRDLARGPARLAQALGLDGTATGTSVLDGQGPVVVVPGEPVEPGQVRSGPRVGVATAADLPWRFWIAGDPFVSAYRRSARAVGSPTVPR
ncbi:MAG TPA: DNA-3-methyladenine glycosylase [Cryptosporangiaceae bacterium]|nr:DNA-3-methyladenine glycosylase [Cryptosporangiaceae bacterium]